MLLRTEPCGEMENHVYDASTLGRSRCFALRKLWRAAVDGRRNLPPCATDAEGRRHGVRPARVYARGHRDRPPGLAEHRRPAARIDLGSRCADRTGLVRGLAAS